MIRSIVAFSLLLPTIPSAGTCHGLALPSDVLIVAPFAPIGRYAGHWGVDIAMSAGSDVAVVGPGIVSFAGPVAGRRSVTVDHGGGIRTSYSYLAGVAVAAGQVVGVGATVGTVGVHSGRGAFHLSLRIGSTYVDPLVLQRCSAVPEPGLWLEAISRGYPVTRDRNPWGNIRPTAHRTSRSGPGRPRAARTR